MTSERELVVQTLAYAALDTLRFALPLDLCAYLHVVDGDGPQLYLRSPDMSTMTAAQAFDVFTALRDTLRDTASVDADPVADAVRIGSYDAIAIRSAGVRSRGVFIVGRADEPLGDDERAVVEDMCAAMALACHTVEEESQASAAGDSTLAAAAPDGGARELVGVSIRIDDGAAHADVIFSDGTRSDRGSADAPTTTEAVALATLTALAPDRKLGEVTEGSVSGERVMIALVRDDAGRARIGTAIVGNDPVRAAAMATADAV